MKGKILIDFLKVRLDEMGSATLGSCLGYSAARISQIEGSESLSEREVLAIFKKALDAERKKGVKDLSEASFSSMEAELSDRQLREYLGVNAQTLKNWRQGGLSPLKMRRLINSVYESGKKESRENLISPICEFVEINQGHSANNKKKVLCKKTSTSYYSDIINVLGRKKGIYIFYDSCGRALYVGKTEKKDIWFEMNVAYGRHRPTQHLYVVKHPSTNKKWVRETHSKARITKTRVDMSDVAKYFSAYEVDEHQIAQIEALLIRAFPNDLMNVRMEKF